MSFIRGYIDPDTGELREEIVPDPVPAASTVDTTALREKIEKATTVAGLRSAMLDVVTAIDTPPSSE